MVTSKLKTEENTVSESNVKEVNGTIDTKAVTDTSDVPCPFPPPLTRPVTPDVAATSAADSKKKVDLSSQTAVAPQIPMAKQATAQAAVTTPVLNSTTATQSLILVSDSQYLLSGGFNQYIVNNKKYANRKTGFKNWKAIYTIPCWQRQPLISNRYSWMPASSPTLTR